MNRKNNESNKEVLAGVQQTNPKPYSKPQVTIHGSLEEITQAIGTGTKDGLSGSTLL
jgi:hypothetical protein